MWKIQLHFYSILAENGKAKLERLIENVALESCGKNSVKGKVATKSVAKFTLRQKLPQNLWQNIDAEKIAPKFPELENGKTN